MDNLVMCPCGHTLASHAADGCVGDRNTGCRCRRDKTLALDAAVEASRTQPWRPPDETDDRRTA